MSRRRHAAAVSGRTRALIAVGCVLLAAAALLLIGSNLIDYSVRSTAADSASDSPSDSSPATGQNTAAGRTGGGLTAAPAPTETAAPGSSPAPTGSRLPSRGDDGGDDPDPTNGESTAPGETTAPAAPPVTATSGVTVEAEPACPGVVCTSVLVSGDVLLHPPLWQQALDDAAAGPDHYDFGPLLAGQQPYLASADLGICHLETPLAAPGGPYQGFPDFTVPPEIAQDLKDVGYDACSTASNHSFDAGTDGINRTLDTLDAVGLDHAGTARSREESRAPVLLRTPTAVIGFISGTYGLNGGAPTNAWQVTDLETGWLLQQAAAAKAAGADLVVVSMHAGQEYQQAPTAAQQQVAQTLLASPDVDFVAGHHAHVVQPLQQFNNKWVAYGLGNTVAAHGIADEANREGLMVRVQFSKDDQGVWTTADVSWVPSLMPAAAPYRWCSLTAGAVCSTAAGDAAARTRITTAVNALGADQAGAHPLDPG